MKNISRSLAGLNKFFVFTFFVLVLANCSKDDPDPNGKISGKVTATAGAGLTDVTVIAFDASNNSPVSSAKTDASGSYTISVPPGKYFVKFSKQGYDPVPVRGSEAISFEVIVGQTTTRDAQMSASSVSNAGYISGKVSVGDKGKSGVLVVAESNAYSASAVSDADGNFAIFNVPAGSYGVKGYFADYSSTTAAATVTANTETKGANISLTQGATGQFSGTFKVISQTTIQTQPTTMDISLVHPVTRETIPGLSQALVYSSAISFTFSKIPNGTYIVRATYANDYIVIDPDYVQKFGDYKITISNGVASPATLDIVATGAVLLSGPTNQMNTTQPEIVTTGSVTFNWQAYPSTNDYVIEVTDANTGAVIWGGFTNSGGTVTKNITIPSSTTSIAYNADGGAKAPLSSGKVYRWKIYASRTNQAGWFLIAASEDQMGLFRIQ